MSINDFPKLAIEHQKKYKQFLAKKLKSKLLKHLPDLHEEAFKNIDCLTCANCCKNHSPRFKQPDIKRISKYLSMKEGDFATRYLKIDFEGDYVTQMSPCPFLGSDNYCSIYESRPSDCRRFPYTDEDVLFDRPNLTQINSTVCPAVFYVLEKLVAITK